jgi:peptidoglycan/xylan/chitin deacetylase (PgdA/CDA1 family)
MKFFFFLSLSIYSITLSAQQIAITLDDAPFGYSAGMSDESKGEAFDRILDALKKYGVTATFLVTASNISEENKVILDRAKAAGHQLGNHTNYHSNLNEVSAATYMADIDQCKELAGDWFNSNYFRYSFLRRGNTREKRDSVYAHLDAKGYVIAPVSIDNDEWIYNRDFSIALSKNNRKAMDSIGRAYVIYMGEISNRYKDLSIKLTSRQVSQILLIHANPINSYYLDQLLDWYKSNGWTFITLDEAMKDEIYQERIDLIQLRGSSVLDMMLIKSKEK